MPVSLRVSKDKKGFVPLSRIKFNACEVSSFQRINPQSPGDAPILISRTGGFSGTLYALRGGASGGTRSVSGRFGAGGKTVSGTFRIVKEGCDSGPITFTAAKATVGLPAGSFYQGQVGMTP